MDVRVTPKADHVARALVAQKATTSDIVTHELLGDINKFDASAVIAQAKAYKTK